MNNTNWLSDQPLGEWFGVTIDDPTLRIGALPKPFPPIHTLNI